MAESAEHKPLPEDVDGPDSLASSPDEPTGRSRISRRQSLVGVAAAALILLAAWLVTGRAGLDSVGKGGINSDLLPKIGDEAPDFTAVTASGEIVSLSDFRGRPVWLNFWGAWCPPCRAEMPDIQAAYEQLEPQGLVLLAVSLGDVPSEAIEFADKNGVTFTILLDPARSLTGYAYPIYNFPTHIFVDKDGIVRNIVLSAMSVDEALAAANTIMPDTALGETTGS